MQGKRVYQWMAKFKSDRIKQHSRQTPRIKLKLETKTWSPFSLVQIRAAGHVNASPTTQSCSNVCGKWQVATNSRLPCHTHLGKVVFYSSHQERRSISLLFETGLDHICFGQKDISRHDADRGLYRHLGARVYTVLLIFEIWKPPGEVRQARNKRGQETRGADTRSLSWSHPRPRPKSKQESKSV